MTTTTAIMIEEAAAIGIAAEMAINSPQWTDAMNTALARRGTRDALISALVREHGVDRNAWATIDLSILLLERIDTFAAYQNYRALQAVIAYILGDNEVAKCLLEQQPEHKFSSLLWRVVDNGIEPKAWAAVTARMTLEECLVFNG